jgi:hypothetical protein
VKHRILALIATLLVLNCVVGPSARASSDPDPARPAAPGVTVAPRPPDVVRFTFDGSGLLSDVTGHGHDLSPVSRHGGTFATAAHNGGKALVFPPPCHDEPCPRIALRAPTAPDLDPGTRPIRWGASVKLAPTETTKGENVVQKGYSASGSQYKLQVDGLAGDPSCVMVDDRRPGIHVAKSRVSVSDGRWHTLECRRRSEQLIVLVDGVQRGRTTVPADLSVRNRIPFAVGGKGSFSNNDQFQGELDDVWVSIG